MFGDQYICDDLPYDYTRFLTLFWGVLVNHVFFVYNVSKITPEKKEYAHITTMVFLIIQ